MKQQPEVSAVFRVLLFPKDSKEQLGFFLNFIKKNKIESYFPRLFRTAWATTYKIINPFRCCLIITSDFFFSRWKKKFIQSSKYLYKNNSQLLKKKKSLICLLKSMALISIPASSLLFTRRVTVPRSHNCR